jgi:RNA recognition motif-containing protein
MKLGNVKLFVSNFDDSTGIVSLLMLFAECGEVVGIKLLQGQKRRYALVEMPAFDAESAIAELDGKHWGGGRLQVKESKY